MSTITVDRRLYLTVAGDLVEHGDPSAAFLWAAAGEQVAVSDAEQVGYRPLKARPAVPSDVPATGPDVEHECDVCGFVAKTAGGLGAHSRTHDQGDADG